MGNEEELRQILHGFATLQEEENVATSMEEGEDISNKVSSIKGYQSVS